MSSIIRKIQRNADNFMVDQYYKNMTPEMYKEGIERAVNMAERELAKRYDAELHRLADEYRRALQDATLTAMDTLATEMIYELGNILECYVDEPDHLSQKIDIVQGIYETAMRSIEDYASDKYKTSTQAQKAYKKKKKTIQKIFGMKGR